MLEHQYHSFRPPTASSAEAEEQWAFDLDGYVVLRRCLSRGSNLVDAEGCLRLPATLAAAIQRLCGTEVTIHGLADNDKGFDQTHDRIMVEYRLAEPPFTLRPRTNSRDGWETDTTPQALQALAYEADSPRGGQHAHCWGLRLIVCTEAAELLVVCGSHKSQFPPPSLAVAISCGATTALELNPGDVVLAAGSTLVGISSSSGSLMQHLLVDKASSASGPKTQLAAAYPHLSHEQRQLMLEPYEREAPTAPPSPSSTLRPAKKHPIANTVFAADPTELWFWDTFGYLIVHGIMDDQWLKECNDALSACRAQGHFQEVVLCEEAEYNASLSSLIAPLELQHEERVAGLWALPGTLGDPFRRMIVRRQNA
eukprot:SAG31_NODE_6393_length_2035_cov_1.564050_1_plen_368_part_00